MKSFVCILVASVLFAFTVSHADAATTTGLITAARLKLEQVFGRQKVTPNLSAAAVARLQVIFERKVRLLRLGNAIAAYSGCLAGKQEAVTSATKALNSARDCTYNGLTFAEYAELRDLCQSRNSLSGNALTAALDACLKIGRTAPDYAPPVCPSVSGLKTQLAQATSDLLSCGTGGFTATQVENQLRAIDTEVTTILDGQPTPSNDPRFPALEAF